MLKYPNLNVYFITNNMVEVERLKNTVVDVHYFIDIRSIPLFLRTNAYVTSHGTWCIPFVGVIHKFLPFFKWKHGTKWIDVWHGLGWVHTERGKMLRDYDLAFDTSEFFREYDSEGDEFIAQKIKITGYPRNDPLIDGRWSRKTIENELGIPSDQKTVLYAPTWGHKYKKSVFPWKETISFLDKVEKFCDKNNCVFLIRMHPNWYRQNIKEKELLEEEIKQAKRIFHLAPYKYIDVQPLLYISDVLITDWSSIANDFILLKRPIIFLETQFPVEKFVLNPKDRAGYIVKDKEEFFETLRESIINPNLFDERRIKLMKKLFKFVNANASKECINEIIRIIQ